MILIGVSIFSFDDLGMFQTNNGIGVPTSIDFTNSIIDEVHIKEDTNTTFTPEKEVWLPSTIALAKFQGDLHYGNFTLYGLEITTLKFRKRKTNELKWITFGSLPFSKDINTYEIIDRLIESGEEYEYAVLPTTSTIEGDMKKAIITTEFEGMFISDKDSYYKLIYNYNLGDINFNSQNSLIETLGNTYPTIMYSSSNFQSGSLQCMLVSDSTITTGGSIDIKVEKALRRQIMTFLTNKKPKVLRDSSGNFMIINILNTPRLIPHNELNQQLYDLFFEFVEVANPHDENSLLLTGLV
jgi:hypothetical protein